MKQILSIILILAFILTGVINYTCAKESTNTTDNKNNLTVDEVDIGPYMSKMQREIKTNWNPPNIKTTKHVVLLYKINKDGTVPKSEILKSSGSKKMDASALEALNKSTPFSPLPKKFKGDNIDVQFTFDYNVHKNMSEDFRN